MIDRQVKKITRLLFTIVPLAFLVLFPLPTMAEVLVNVNISLPPTIAFVEPPELIVLPETNIYVYPDMDMDIFFYDGWWWRLWEDRWYRSRDYNSGWNYYRSTPSFYSEVPSDWRNNYREHSWRGHQWNYQRIPHRNVQQNWRGWEKSRYWEHQQNWGVQDLQPQTQSRHPVREEQQRQSRPQAQKIKSGQSQQHRETSPQARKVIEQKDAQPQGKHLQQQQEKHEGGKEENQEKR